MLRFIAPVFFSAFLVAGWSFPDQRPSGADTDWPEYLGGGDRNHFSPLTGIHPGNVADLQVAWTYEVPDSGQVQTNPIVVNGRLYGITAALEAFALDAATGKELWRFGDGSRQTGVSRGLTFWQDGGDQRILHSIGSFLYALDARTGRPIPSFGDNGRVDLHTGLPEVAAKKHVTSTTPGTLFEDLIIMPVRLSEGADAAPGDIRAFNVRTGQLAWTFHTIPHPGEFGYGTFPENAHLNTFTGGANNWAGMAIDREKGIVYVPTGSAGYDFYGGARKGENLFANCLIALNARTGKRLWHFQAIHHDLWDRDLPAPPNLITVRRNGRRVEAVAQVTKHGHVFLFDRVTGKPLFTVVEKKAPGSMLPGEETWPTQPVPVLPEPFARQAHQLTENDISPFASNRDSLLQRFRKYRKEWFAAPSREGTVIFPGFDGGAEWGGAAADPEAGILYVNSNEMAWILTMKETPREQELQEMTNGQRVFIMYCATCHGYEQEGSSAPSLVSLERRMTRQAVGQLVASGRGMMPGFPMISQEERQALIAFLFKEEKKEVSGTSAPVSAEKSYTPPFKSTGYNKFLDADGLPAIAPPWGTLNAIDMNTGKYLWKIPLGEVDSLTARGIPLTGTENYGGPVVTASGLLFIAATKDERFRAYDRKTGRLLWETRLPASGFATPSTYQVNGKQYVVIACGGTKLGRPKGNKYVAFALP